MANSTFKPNTAADVSVNSTSFTSIWTGRFPNITNLAFPSDHCFLVLDLQCNDDNFVRTETEDRLHTDTGNSE